MKSQNGYHWPKALFVLSVNLYEVIAERVTAFENINMTHGMVSGVGVTVARSSSGTRSPDKVLQTFAEHLGMLRERFNEEWGLVAPFYNKHCCPSINEPPDLPVGGRDLSLFIVDYSNLPSLAVLVTNDSPIRAQFAVVYGKDGSIANPIFGILESLDAFSVKANFQLSLSDGKTDIGDVGIFQIPDPQTPNQLVVYQTAGALQHATAFDGFKSFNMIEGRKFDAQAWHLGMTLTSVQGKFHTTNGILKMMPDVPGDSLFVADLDTLHAGSRSLAIWFSSNGMIYPAMVSWAEYDESNRWKVFVRYLTQHTIEVLDQEITCALFGPDLTPVFAPPPKPTELKEEFEEQLRKDFQTDPFKAAVIAANLKNMPSLAIPEGYFDSKVKTLDFEDGLDLYVLYHHAQRKHAYQNKRIFEHVFAGAERNIGALGLLSFDTVASKLTYPAAMTFLLSQERFAMGWAMDGVEVGTGHNCLIKHEQEKVYIAGEIMFEGDERVRFNFLSGTFTRQIIPLYDPGEASFHDQWIGLISALIGKAWYSQLQLLLHDKYKALLKVPTVTYTDDVLIPFEPPVQSTKMAFCSSEPWMQSCACIASGDSNFNWCKKLEGKNEPCEHDDCQPSGR
mmetsp:Transcript_23291/g.44685  ORF Transcript_23291/g.44685 Transcript_23291/m.44685 type:complete len:620 (+) Transcript_23291:72-1931(+)